MKILDATWFNTVGIVATKNEMDEINFYIGIGNGFSEEIDRKHIAEWGTKINTENLIHFFEVNSK